MKEFDSRFPAMFLTYFNFFSLFTPPHKLCSLPQFILNFISFSSNYIKKKLFFSDQFSEFRLTLEHSFFMYKTYIIDGRKRGGRGHKGVALCNPSIFTLFSLHIYKILFYVFQNKYIYPFFVSLSSSMELPSQRKRSISVAHFFVRCQKHETIFRGGSLFF